MSNIKQRIQRKNSLTFWGARLNHVSTIGQSWWKALYPKDVLEKKAKRWESMEAEDAEQGFYSIGGWPAPRSSNLGPFANNGG